MPITDYKVTDADISSQGVSAAPDTLTGTAAENKTVFDRLPSYVVKKSLNPLIDALSSPAGAAEIGALVDGLDGDNVQELLRSAKAYIDNIVIRTGAMTVVSEITLPAAGWAGEGPYTQPVALAGATASSMVDLQPDAAVLAQLANDGVTAIFVVNDAGALAATAVGAKPTADLTVQCTVEEVIR